MNIQVSTPDSQLSSKLVPARQAYWLFSVGLSVFLFFFVVSAHAQNAQAGLWIGTVSLNQVSDPKAALTESGGKFEFRILFHVNGSGAVKLLKEVIVMKRTTPPNDLVLITDPAKIPNYGGIVRTPGKSAGIRYSASAYDFTGIDGPVVSGRLEKDGSLGYTLVATPTDPTNPFRHKFHPEHATGRAYTREVLIAFRGSNVADTVTGVKRISGTYKETIKSLVKADIALAGTITLDRVSTITALNP